jgi:hypothetical protein
VDKNLLEAQCLPLFGCKFLQSLLGDVRFLLFGQ